MVVLKYTSSRYGEKNTIHNSCKDNYFRGWKNGSVKKALVAQIETLSLYSLSACKKARCDRQHVSVIPVLQMHRWRISGFAGQLDPASKIQGAKQLRRHQKSASGTYTHTHTHTGVGEQTLYWLSCAVLTINKFISSV